MNPRTDNVTENHSTNIKIYYLTNSGRRAQINATTGSYQFDAFYSRHSQQTQQYPKDRCGRRSEQTTGSSKRRKEKDSFQFHFCMLMLPFKRMRVYDNHPIYHMRVSKKGNTSQIGNKYQWKEKLQNMNQMLLHRNGGKDRTISNSSQYLLIVVMDLKPETSLLSCQRKCPFVLSCPFLIH